MVAPLWGQLRALGEPATPPPNTFGLRLEGFAVEVNSYSTATAVTPRTAYSYAKIYSSLDLDGGRGLDIEARGANDQWAGLGGAALFGGDVPTDGNNLPGYAQAFFPTFEGFSQVAEKCAANETESREAPECRDQPGPYAFAQVVPDQNTPRATGIGRNEGGDGQGDARSSSTIEPQAHGSVVGTQRNEGSEQGVPGTPIMVESFLAEQSVTTSLQGSTVEINCEGEVTVAGQPVNDNKQLQQALAPLTLGGDLRVEFEPATEPEVEHLAGGGLQASCRGPRLTVYAGAQGGSGVTYTYGKTFAAVGQTDNRESGLPRSGSGGFVPPPSEPSANPSNSSESVAPPPATGSTSVTSGPAPAPNQPPAPAPGPVDQPMEETANSQLVRLPIDTTPIGLLTAAAAGLLPLGIWLLLGVTGSLARGLPQLRLPPFTD